MQLLYLSHILFTAGDGIHASRLWLSVGRWLWVPRAEGCSGCDEGAQRLVIKIRLWSIRLLAGGAIVIIVVRIGVAVLIILLVIVLIVVLIVVIFVVMVVVIRVVELVAGSTTDIPPISFVVPPSFFPVPI